MSTMRRTSVEPIRKLYNDPYVLYIGIFSFLHSFTTYIGGNQREKDRERAAKKAAANAKKPKESASSLAARKEACVDFLALSNFLDAV